MDVSLGVVTCGHCGSLHDIPGKRDALAEGGAASGGKPSRLEVDLPSRFKLRRSAGGMEVSWPMGRPFQGVVLLIITGAFAYVAIQTGFLILLLFCAGLVYFAATRVFNTRRIRVDGARLEFTQGPLPWPGSKKLAASDVEQLYATEHESRTETGTDNNRQVEIRKFYRLSARTRSSGKVTVLSGLSDPMQALWLEQEIERLLGIGDEAVAGAHTL